jgi:O-antigen/teichoic acid export membrane protein
VAVCASLQILSNFVDAGFSQIVPRWAAQEANHPSRLRQYVVLFRRIYICLALTTFLILQVSANYLAHSWFQVPVERAETLELAIRIVSFQFLFQFINNLHIGLWHGLQRQVQANILACGFGTLKHTTALLALYFIAPQAWVYATAFAVVACLEVSFNALSIKRLLSRESSRETGDKVMLVPMLKEVSVLSIGILVGLFVSQLDRIVLGRIVDVASFGIYTVVATLALAFLQLQAPLTRAYFPLIVRDIQSHGKITSIHIKRLLGGTLIVCTLPALLACALAQQILEIWLNDPIAVNLGTVPLRLLLLAIALNSLYDCIYQVIIAKGQSHKVLQFNLISLAVAALVIYLRGTEDGLILGGLIWISTTFTQLLLGLIWWFATSQRETQ